MASITEIGLQEPIDVLVVDGTYYGFSGCHRYEVLYCATVSCALVLAWLANRVAPIGGKSAFDCTVPRLKLLPRSREGLPMLRPQRCINSIY